MKSVVVRCPECNAVLEAGSETREVRCSYCGTLAQVQRRTGLFQRAEPLPPKEPEAPSLPVATQPRNAAVLVIGAILGTLPFALAIILPALLCNTLGGSTPYGPFVLADANGDGIEDVVALIRNRDSEVMRLAAFDGKTGKKLWRSEEVARGSNLSSQVLCPAQGVVLHGNGGPELRALGLGDGKQRYVVRLGEAVKGVCEGPDPGRVMVVLADKRMQLLSLADGAVGEGGPAAACRALRCDTFLVGLRAGDGVLVRADFEAVRRRSRLPGMSADHYVRPTGSDLTIAIGHKSPGTAVPMLASIRDVRMARPRAGELGGDGTAVLWQTAIPAGDPLTAGGGAGVRGDKVALDQASILVAYEAGDRQHLGLFELADGKRRWDAVLPEAARAVWSVALTPRLAIASSTWGLLCAFDLATGRPVFVID